MTGTFWIQSRWAGHGRMKIHLPLDLSLATEMTWTDAAAAIGVDSFADLRTKIPMVGQGLRSSNPNPPRFSVTKQNYRDAPFQGQNNYWVLSLSDWIYLLSLF